MLHDPTEVTQRMDHFGEQRGEDGMEEDAAETLHKEELAEEAMDLSYQPGSYGEEDSNNTDSPHSPEHASEPHSPEPLLLEVWLPGQCQLGGPVPVQR